MHRLWPREEPDTVDDDELERLYDYPADKTWVAVNFVSSADGAVEIAGRSHGLSNPVDKQVYLVGSDLSDVILVGAGTVMAEEYHGLRPGERNTSRRRRHGLTAVPRIAVVTTGNSLPPDAPVITDVHVPSIVITCATAPRELREAWVAAGAEVIVAGTDRVDLTAGVDALAAQGLRRINCEGGPRLFGSLLAEGLVDELRLTLSPLLVSGAADRIASGRSIEPSALDLASVLVEDGTLLLRYLVRR